MRYSPGLIARIQDEADFGTMKALMEMKAQHPATYRSLRDSVAVHRAENEYKRYLHAEYSEVA